MHTEHLQRVRFGLVFICWFVAAGVASLLVFAIYATRLIDMSGRSGTQAAIASIAVGFFAGGLFAGLRAGEAPLLHGTALGLLSLVVWVALNAISALLFPGFGWSALTPGLALSVVLVQMAAAILGARAGYRVRVGKTSL